jgi:hypothetical protein
LNDSQPQRGIRTENQLHLYRHDAGGLLADAAAATSVMSARVCRCVMRCSKQRRLQLPMPAAFGHESRWLVVDVALFRGISIF